MRARVTGEMASRGYGSGAGFRGRGRASGSPKGAPKGAPKGVSRGGYGGRGQRQFPDRTGGRGGSTGVMPPLADFDVDCPKSVAFRLKYLQRVLGKSDEQTLALLDEGSSVTFAEIDPTEVLPPARGGLSDDEGTNKY